MRPTKISLSQSISGQNSKEVPSSSVPIQLQEALHSSFLSRKHRQTIHLTIFPLHLLQFPFNFPVSSGTFHSKQIASTRPIPAPGSCNICHPFPARPPGNVHPHDPLPSHQSPLVAIFTANRPYLCNTAIHRLSNSCRNVRNNLPDRLLEVGFVRNEESWEGVDVKALQLMTSMGTS